METSGCRTRQIETSRYRPRFTHCGTNPKEYLFRSWRNQPKGCLWCRNLITKKLLVRSVKQVSYKFIFARSRSHTGWRRCIGCLKLQVSFRKWATNYRALLRKTTYKDEASYVWSPPCMSFCLEYMRSRSCGNFPSKSPIISRSFAKRDLQLEASYASVCVLSRKIHGIHFTWDRFHMDSSPQDRNLTWLSMFRRKMNQIDFIWNLYVQDRDLIYICI